jgi:hypothetical protein
MKYWPIATIVVWVIGVLAWAFQVPPSIPPRMETVDDGARHCWRIRDERLKPMAWQCEVRTP